ncbi:MAG TPA: N-acetyltransferase [Caulobacteraceae bacterium]|jgi:predicted N-acetyltransferase YhbS
MSTPAPTAKPAGLEPILTAERPEDFALIDSLIERAFGPGRFVKTAERLRERNTPRRDLSLVAWAGGDAVGCVRMWPIHIGEASAVLLGPFAVDDAWRSRGLGAQLIQAACAAAEQAGVGVVLLVGDEPYFGKFGFERVPQGRAVLPGPVDGRRLMWRAMRPGALEGVEGQVRAG